MSFLGELKRRSVFKAGIAYAVTGWLLLTIAKALSAPAWSSDLLLVIFLVGFLPALIVAWHFELTPTGIKLHKKAPSGVPPQKKRGRRLEYAVVIMAGLSLGIYVWESRFEQKVAEYEARAAEAAKAAAAPPTRPPRISDPEKIDDSSIAVLPFKNLTAAAEDQYFTDGVHEDLLIQLSKIEAFSVISRGSVMEYRNTSKNLREISRELSVANVVQGSVQRAGDRVRISVQLIDAGTDGHLWAQIYDRELTAGNLFDIQAEIAKSVAAALRATLTDAELADAQAAPTDNVAAYDLYLQGRQFAQQETLRGYESAVELFQQALALDPEFKNAWIRLARAHMTNYWVYGGNPANRDLARAAIEKARDIDADFGELHMAEGFYWYWGHLDYERALYHLSKAIEMMPGNDEGHMWRGWVSRRAGRWDQAVTSMQEALRLNPRVHFNWHEYALTLRYLHRYEESRTAIMEARSLDPESFWGRTTQAEIGLQQSGDLESALNLTAGAQRSSEYDFFRSYMGARILARRFEDALAAARAIPDEMEIQRNLISLREDWAAQILHFMGRREDAERAAGAALFRLQRLRDQLKDDYRLDLAEAMSHAVLGTEPEKLGQLVRKSMASQPDDALEAFRFSLAHARIFAIAGLAAESIMSLEPILAPPSDTSVCEVDLDPAFDRIRDDPEFTAMLERYR